jgi:DNA-binding NarL/FixJ family response regulator
LNSPRGDKRIKNSILIVDDDETMRKRLKALGSAIPDIDISEAVCTETALQILKCQSIDLIITEIKMPDWEGLEFIATLRANDGYTPVIFISDCANKEMLIRALRLGPIDFIEKPFEDFSFLSIVLRALAANKNKVMPRLESLSMTATQTKVLHLLLKGLTNKDIAFRVNLSEQGVKYHITKLFKRFESADRRELREKVWSLVEVA